MALFPHALNTNSRFIHFMNELNVSGKGVGELEDESLKSGNSGGMIGSGIIGWAASQ